MTFLIPLLIFAQVVFTPPVKIGVAGEGTPRSAKTPIPFPAEDEKWVRIVTSRFDIISAATDRRTREVARDLETLASALHELQPASNPAAPRVRVVIFGRRKDVQPYFDVLMQHDNTNLGGLFIGHRDRGAMLIDGSHVMNYRTPYHELIHALLATRGPRPPLWLEEGLAEFYSNADIRNGRITFGYSIFEHIILMRRQSPMPLKEVFAMRYESDASTRTIFYAESWAVVDLLMRINRKVFPDFVADLSSGATVEQALQTRYQLTVSGVERGVALYPSADRPQFTFSVVIPQVAAVAPSVPLSQAEVLYHLGTFLALVPGLEPDAEHHFRGALAIDPKNGRALAAIANLRVAAKKFDEADQLYARAAEASPDDPEVLLGRAESLMRDELGQSAETTEVSLNDIARFHKAREVAQMALAQGTDPARAYGVIGSSYMRDADMAPGIVALEKAHTLIPSRADYALHLFSMLRQSGQTQKADALFAELDSMHDEQVSFASRAVLLRLEVDHANALIHQEKFSEAAAVLHSLVAQTGDQTVKGDLERQAEDIDRLADVNRQILTYNEAVALVNGHHLKEAVLKLDALLAIATDPKVIADATRLRAFAAKAR